MIKQLRAHVTLLQRRGDLEHPQTKELTLLNGWLDWLAREIFFYCFGTGKNPFSYDMLSFNVTSHTKMYTNIYPSNSQNKQLANVVIISIKN